MGIYNVAISIVTLLINILGASIWDPEVHDLRPNM